MKVTTENHFSQLEAQVEILLRRVQQLGAENQHLSQQLLCLEGQLNQKNEEKQYASDKIKEIMAKLNRAIE